MQSIAYYILTFAERGFSGRGDAAKGLRVPFEVLKKIGELSSTRGSASTARMALPGRSAELSRSEKRWLGRAARLLLLQWRQRSVHPKYLH